MPDAPQDRPAFRVRHLTTTRADGDLSVKGDPEVLAERRSRVVDLPWTWLDQVHGAEVVVVDRPGAHAGDAADAAVTDVPGAVLAIHTADCVPVVLIDADDAAVGVAHAGWRGLAAGVVGRTAEAMASLGRPPVRAVIGPCIGPDRYEFGGEDLDRVAALWGEDVRAVTAEGTPALDVARGVRSALQQIGVTDIAVDGRCTADDADQFWSYRARGDAGRIATVAWIEARP